MQNPLIGFIGFSSVVCCVLGGETKTESRNQVERVPSGSPYGSIDTVVDYHPGRLKQFLVKIPMFE